MGLSSDLAGVFQIILAQQEAEERREARGEQTALTLLSMQMKEAESTRGVLLKEYYDKKDEIAETKEMYLWELKLDYVILGLLQILLEPNQLYLANP